jgi:prepilin-type N-terminal cleavage/methylation domain-containing protein
MFMKFMEMMKRKNNKKGFTLVELMVVVVIIGILVAIAVPVYNSATGNAARNACWANQRTIEGACSTYNTASAGGGYPATVTALVGSYLQAEPTCGTTTKYYYCISTTTGRVTGTATSAGQTSTTFACGHSHY